MKTFHECGLLLLALFAVVLLVFESICGCGKKAPFVVEKDTKDKDELSEQLVRCRSEVDGMALECTLYFPEDYDFSHPRPLIVVLPEMSLPDEWHAGQALVARLENARPEECPNWLLHEDIRNAIDYLCDNHPVMRNQIYLAAGGISGFEFACMNAQRFAGIYLQLEETVFSKWEELPLHNLVNVPLFLQNDNFSPVATELQQRLQRAGARYLNAPEFLLASTPSDGIVQAFAWLSAQKTSRESILWEGSRGMPRDAWWIRADEITAGQMGTVNAKYDRDSRRIYLYTKGVEALSVDTGWDGFGNVPSLDVEIDGCIFEISVTRGWGQLAKDGDGLWDVAPIKRQKAAERTDFRMHGLRAVMSRPVLVVYGSANEEREEAWKKAAEEFVDAWQAATGCRPEVCKDNGISQEMLDDRNLLFFGSPADNSLTEALLEDDASFLRRLYDSLEGDARVDDDLTCVTLYPDDTFSKGGIAAIVLANDVAGIANSWRAIFEDSEADFVFQGKFGKSFGYFSSDWEIEE